LRPTEWRNAPRSRSVRCALFTVLRVHTVMPPHFTRQCPHSLRGRAVCFAFLPRSFLATIPVMTSLQVRLRLGRFLR
jgi:hypothetical protein